MRSLFSFLLLVTLLAPLVPVHASTSTVMFQMSDGSYYHPGTGKKAATRAQLLLDLGIPTESISPLEGQDVAQAIARAKTLLQDRLLQKQQSQNAVITTKAVNDTWLPVTLAVWDKTTNQVSLREIMRKGKDVQALDGLNVQVIFSNGVNSEYGTPGDTQIIVGNIHPILKQKSTTQSELVPVIYTPYSEGIHTTSMVKSGHSYINDVVTQVYQELRTQQVPSGSLKGRLMVDVVDPETVKAIALIEHADTATMQVNPKEVAESFYVTVAANQNDVYAYARSSAGALGLVQFIPSTYNWLVKQRPDIGLIKDFETGMRTPTNAIKAQIAYLDLLIREMPEITPTIFDTQRSRVQEYLVAAYNGGSGKVRRALDEWDANVLGQQKTNLAELASKHATLDKKVADLQAKIKATKGAAALKTLKAELATVQKQHDIIASQEINLKKFALASETRSYVQKYRSALAVTKQIENSIYLATY